MPRYGINCRTLDLALVLHRILEREEELSPTLATMWLAAAAAIKVDSACVRPQVLPPPSCASDQVGAKLENHRMWVSGTATEHLCRVI